MLPTGQTKDGFPGEELLFAAGVFLIKEHTVVPTVRQTGDNLSFDTTMNIFNGDPKLRRISRL